MLPFEQQKHLEDEIMKSQMNYNCDWEKEIERPGRNCIILMKGLPGSGKSTCARRMVEVSGDTLVRVNRDELRQLLFNSEWSRNREKIIVEAELNAARAAIQEGRNVVVDDTNLSRKAQGLWREFAHHMGISLWWLHINTPIEECIARDALREGKARVGAGVIWNMAIRNGFVKWDSNDRFVAFDLDGTLFNCDHRLHYVKDGRRDWEKFFRACIKDTPIDWVRSELQAYHREGKKIIIVTASPEDYADARIETMKKFDIPFHYLIMRKSGDRRNDVIVKEEMLSFLPYDRIEAFYDDRPQVVQMLRGYGLNVIDCGVPELIEGG